LAYPALAATVTYQYDNAGRLRSTSYGGCTSTGTTSYTLDAAGNRKQVQTAAGSGAGRVQLATTSYNVSEAVGSFTIEVTRSCGSSGEASVSYSVSGSATQGADYSLSGTLSWGSGDASSKYLTVSVVNDSAYEGTETLLLTLQGASGATLGDASQTTATVIIADDDVPPVPAAPTLSLGSHTAGTISYTFSWTAPATATSYQFYSFNVDGFVYQGPNTTKTASVPSCEADTFYVQACNAYGCSAQSNSIHIYNSPNGGQLCN